MCKRWFGLAGIGLMLWVPPAFAAKAGKAAASYPVFPVVVNAQADTVYPSVAGDFLVYSQRQDRRYSVVRASRRSPDAINRTVRPEFANEAIRDGVALADGGIGYVSSRMGPIGAWEKLPQGDGHVAIANLGTYSGGVVPDHLSASADGRIWSFDTSLDNTRRARMLTTFSDPSQHWQLRGQSWRLFTSGPSRIKVMYRATKTGTPNKFSPPSLFTYDRDSGRLMMFPNAFDGAVSPDGKQVAFVRENDGNFDIWVQHIDGSGLAQVTSSTYGDFEPAWSPDGTRLAFVSNRDAEGSVRHTSIYVIDLKTSVVTRVTDAGEATDGGPTWLDGNTILFHSDRDPKKPQSGTITGWNIWKARFQEVH